MPEKKQVILSKYHLSTGWYVNYKKIRKLGLCKIKFEGLLLLTDSYTIRQFVEEGLSFIGVPKGKM